MFETERLLLGCRSFVSWVLLYRIDGPLDLCGRRGERANARPVNSSTSFQIENMNEVGCIEFAYACALSPI